jgi:cytochrome c oxidase assembly protein subunit 15
MRSVKKWVRATFILCFLVIIAGGVVRTTQSGMGCPDWPTCFGKWIPPMNASDLPLDFEKYLRVQDIDHHFNAFHTWTEYINRLLGVLLGVFAIIQLGLIWQVKEKNKNAYQLALAFLIIVILTGLFGAAVVKLNLADISITVHLFFAFLLTQVQLALFMSVRGKLYKKTAGIRIRRVLLLLLIVILIQAVLGTAVRMYVDRISKALHYGQRDAWLATMPVAFLIHRAFSVFTLFAVLYASRYCRKVPALKPHMRRLLGITLVSMMSGIVLYYLDFPALAQPVHLLLAALAITLAMNALLYTKNTTDLLKPQSLKEA